jgi:hypothetical protein
MLWLEEEMTMNVARRDFVVCAGRMAGAAALLGTAGIARAKETFSEPRQFETDVVRDTLNGFVAFVVPGPDEYSAAQGVTTPEPGGLAAFATDFLIGALNLSAPFQPHFAAVVAGILNDIAHQVNPSASGTFPSIFARLSFAEKTAVLSVMEGLEPLKPLAGVLPAVVAFITYSEAPAFDPRTRTVTQRPIGWDLSAYDGVSDGRNDFQGYFRHVAEPRHGRRPKERIESCAM